MSISMPGMLYKCLRISIIKHGIRCNHSLQRQPYFYYHPPPSATEKTYTFRKWIPCSDKKTIVVNENQLSKHKTERVINPRKKYVLPVSCLLYSMMLAMLLFSFPLLGLSSLLKNFHIA